ncbi:MAG TPA: tRNA pseudouridine(55) synthase TruB [bacterium]|nr:tRNA pseudouridine(55) synthase TruB [bacterium]HPN45339.1 tRNA pseudouridine(55) synthase TruB [bacterium]
MIISKPSPDIILNIRKPVGWSSNDVIRYVKHRAQGYKVGHAGTLDPFAEGVLLVCIGKATKKVTELMNEEKEYNAGVRLGMATDSFDLAGTVTQETVVPELSEQLIAAIKNKFIGEMQQTPPDISAVKFNGQRAYHVVRTGGQVELKAKKVILYDLNIDVKSENYLILNVVCSKGTYIRSLARDIAHFIGTTGYVQKLVRMRIGPYRLQSAMEIPLVADYLKDQL